MDNELKHHGVKGMRWGHRKSSIVSTQPRKRIPGMIVKDESQPKPRINIPKTHIKETNSQTKKISKGKKVAAGILAGLGAVIVTDAIINRDQIKETKEWVRTTLELKKLAKL